MLLTDNEVKFMKETSFTPTVFQLDEWERTPFKNYDEALEAAKEYGLKDLECANPENYSEDVEDLGPYLLYRFFTAEELSTMDAKQVVRFLQDFKYYFGFRKTSESDAWKYLSIALSLFGGSAFISPFGRGRFDEFMVREVDIL